MFDLHGIDRLAEWKKFRNTLETASDPFLDVITFWSKAPFVNLYLDYTDPASWPDPWHTVLDSKYDDLAITLGMLYTLLLTDRFSKENYKIYIIENTEKLDKFCLSIGKFSILNLNYGQISHFSELKNYQASMIYEINRQ